MNETKCPRASLSCALPRDPDFLGESEGNPAIALQSVGAFTLILCVLKDQRSRDGKLVGSLPVLARLCGTTPSLMSSSLDALSRMGWIARCELSVKVRSWRKWNPPELRGGPRVGAGRPPIQTEIKINQNDSPPSPSPLIREEEREKSAGKAPAGPAAKGRLTWLTPYGECWDILTGGTPPYGKLASALKPLHDKHGPELVCRALSRYLRSSDAQYLSPSRFAETFGSWCPEVMRPKAQPLSPPLPAVSPEDKARSVAAMKALHEKLATILPKVEKVGVNHG